MSGTFGKPLPLNQIHDGQRIELAATGDERRQIAERLGLGLLERLEAHAVLSCDGATVRARGRLKAAVTQACVITADPVETRLDEPFDIIFLPQPEPGGPDEEVELSEQDCDTVFHDGSAIELGEAIADTLGLGIDPYPRSAGADAALKEAGILSEAQAGPFAALAQLKRGDSDKS